MGDSRSTTSESDDYPFETPEGIRYTYKEDDVDSNASATNNNQRLNNYYWHPVNRYWSYSTQTQPYERQNTSGRLSNSPRYLHTYSEEITTRTRPRHNNDNAEEETKDLDDSDGPLTLSRESITE